MPKTEFVSCVHTAIVKSYILYVFFIHAQLWTCLAYHEGVAVAVGVCVRQVQASRVHSPQFPQTLPTEESGLRGRVLASLQQH